VNDCARLMIYESLRGHTTDFDLLAFDLTPGLEP
jgi:hypothetical protein